MGQVAPRPLTHSITHSDADTDADTPRKEKPSCLPDNLTDVQATMESDLDAPDLRGRASSNHQNHEYDFHHDQAQSPQYSQPQYHSAFDSPSQQLDPSLTFSRSALNQEAADSNLQQHVLTSVNPDDFYKSFHDPRFDHPDPESLPMASTSSATRPNPRSNGDGSTPKQPNTVPTNRSLPRPTKIRSASNPAEGTQPSLPTRQVAKGKTSVKDLRRRFDQNTTQSAIPRAPAQPGTATRGRRDGASRSASSTRGAPSSYTSLRTGGAQDMTNDSRNVSASSRSGRSKFVAEDQVSSNSQSFASRVAKPRAPAGASSNTSRAIPPHIAPESPRNISAPLAPTADLPPQGLLFGEILPDQWDNAAALGFGIGDIRAGTVPEADVQEPWTHQRSLSDPDAELSSPTDWYRDTGARADEIPAPESARGRSHGRSFSDAPSQKAEKPVSRKPATRKPKQAPPSPTPPSSSKLPLSVRKLNSPTGTSSTPSTRSNSPAAVKSKQPNGTVPRAKTPASGRKTPTRGGRKAAPPGLLTPDSSNRLQAYIAAPPPKLSPPLRSSRPRQPVSASSTASSRMKAVERPKPNNSAGNSTSRTNEQTSRRRKISIGPIDFEQRREHIRLAYTKSVRESQALEARQRAAEKRKADLEAAARAKAAAEAASDEGSRMQESQQAPGQAEINTQVSEDASTPNQSVEMPIIIDTISPITVSSRHEDNDTIVHNTTPALTITTDVETEKATATEANNEEHDSPTLGLPGSFPSPSPPAGYEEPPPPLSAISMTSGVTEFDNESQINSPIPAAPTVDIPIAIVKPPSPQSALVTTPRAEYHYPFEDEPMSSPDAQGTRGLVSNEAETLEPYNFHEAGIPTAHEDSCEEDDSALADDVFGAMVTILPPQNSGEMEGGHHSTVPFPRIDMSDDLSDCHSVYEPEPETRHHLHYAHQENADTDSCTEDSGEHDKSEDCQSESRCGDQESSYRASSCASSEAGDDEQQYLEPAGVTSNHLMVPSIKANRTSQQSAWTDFSVDSGHSDVTRTPDLYGEEETESFGHVTIFESRVISRDSDPAPPEINDTASSVRSSCDSARPTYFDQHRLPDGEAGDGFDIPYLSRRGHSGSSCVPSPLHEPPTVPIGDSASTHAESRRGSSAYYAQSQRGSAFINSDRASEDFMSQLETPQTVDSSSYGARDHYFGAPSLAESEIKAAAQDGQELDDKERHRLVQRRNVIRELVDTEAVFVRDMNVVEEIYKGTAEACPKLDPQTVKLIFRNTDEIINFHTFFLGQLKDAVSAIYTPKVGRSTSSREDVNNFEPGQSSPAEISDAKDRTTSLGPVFKSNMEKMKGAHEAFLRSSDQAAKRLIRIQQDPTVKVWLNECNEVAKDLTAAWDLDSLLIKPMQRITKYPNLIITLLQHTPQDHPDREELMSAKETLETAIIDINKTKKNFELVGQIVGRKRKESDVKAGFARAFGKRVDKLQASGARPPEDPEYAKLNEKFGDDYLRLQVVLRDVEFYTRQVSTYVREFLQYLSSVELVMRLQPGSFPELESKWVQFNISVRDLEKVALEEHVSTQSSFYCSRR